MKRRDAQSGDKIANSEPQIQAILSGVETEIAAIYSLYRTSFVRYAARRFSLCDEELMDIYQESFIEMFHNIKSGRLTTLSASLQSYLFEIGNHKILNRLRDNKRRPTQSIDRLPDTDEECDRQNAEWVARQEIANSVVDTMEEPCNTVLRLYYWQRQSMNEIADRMGYKNEQVAKNRKHLCMRRLKEILVAKFSE